MKVIFSIDDGHKQDTRVAELLTQYGFVGIFFIPSCSDLLDREILAISRHHIIGGHTESHPMDLKLLTDEQLDQELRGNRIWLNEVTSQPIKWFAYPRGRYDDRVKEMVRKVGFEWARTTNITREGEDARDNFAIHSSGHIFQRTEYNCTRWQKAIREDFLRAKAENKTFHLFLHTKEIIQFDWWTELEDLLKYINENLHTK